MNDIVAWNPKDHRLACWRSTAFVLGGNQIFEPNLERKPLPVWRSPLRWLKEQRYGIVLARPNAAHQYLDHLPGLIAEDQQHAEELERLLWNPRRRLPIFMRDLAEKAA